MHRHPGPHAALHDAAPEPDLYGDYDGRKMVVLIGAVKALAMAVKGTDSKQRITTLRERLVITGRTSSLNDVVG